VGSPITFSGFNQIDFNQILNAVMQQERIPLTRLETQKKTLETQNSAFATLAGKLSAVQSAVDDLREVDSLSLLTATSSNVGVGVSTTTGTVPGTYDIVVSELARAQVTASQSTYASVDAQVATGGTLTLTPTTGGPVTITLTASTTLSQLAAKINAANGSPVSASVVQSAPGSYQLVLTGKETGSTNAFTITNALTGGNGLTFADVDADGVFDNTVDAINASFTVNNLQVTSASNTVTDVVPGVTLSLLKKDPATSATVKVAQDTTGAKDRVKKLITAYNDVLKFVKEQGTTAVTGKPSIGRDPLLRGLRESMRFAIGDQYAGGTLTRLGEVGIGFDMGGTMILEDKVFDAAMERSPSAVQFLFSGADGKSGAFGTIAALIEDYTEAGGLVASARERIDGQVRTITGRMDALSARLELRRSALQKEYLAADMAMTRLNRQSSSLQSLGGQYRLF
jgi:flagellar hook-associated protein 2